MSGVVLAVLVSVAPQAADGLPFETPPGWERREAAAQRIVSFVPPGLPAGIDCAVVVLPAEDFAGTAQAYLDKLVEGVKQGNQLQGEVRHLDVGAFRSATFALRNAQGALQYAALYVARWEEKAQAVLFASSDAEAFQKHAPTAEALIRKVAVPGAVPAAPPGTALAGLLLPLPPGWTWQDDPSGWVVVTPPPELAWRNPRLLVGTRKRDGSHWAAHRALLKSLVEQAKWPGSTASGPTTAPGPFITSEVACIPADGRVIRLYTAASGPAEMEAVVVGPPGGAEFTAALQSMLERTTLKSPPLSTLRPEVVEGYRRPTARKFVNNDGTTTLGRLGCDRMVFLSNGVVDFTTCYPGGLAGERELLKIDAGTLNGFYGSWRADGKSLRLRRRPDDPEELWERENGRLRFGDQTWAPLPKIDGLRLQGRWSVKTDAKAPVGGLNPWVEFTGDGAFRTGGLLSWLAVGDPTGRPQPPETASGSYEIRDWTLLLKVDGALVWSTDFAPLGEDPKDLDTLLIHTTSFKRE